MAIPFFIFSSLQFLMNDRIHPSIWWASTVRVIEKGKVCDDVVLDTFLQKNIISFGKNHRNSTSSVSMHRDY